MTEQLAYYFLSPLPTVPPNCLMHSEPNTTTGKIDSWCTYPTPTIVSRLNLSQALPSYMRFSDSQMHTFFLSAWGLVGISLIIFALYIYSRWYLMKQKLKEQHVTLWIKPTKETLQNPLATEQLFAQIHSLVSQQTFWEQLFHAKLSLSVELVATKTEGIRYLIHTPTVHAAILKKTLLSYLPGVEVREGEDYLPTNTKDLNQMTNAQTARIVPFTLSRHFALPLQTQNILIHHDPIAYVTGTMTKLAKNELIALQLVLSPVTPTSNFRKIGQAEKILNHLWHGKDLTPLLRKRGLSWYLIFLPLTIAGTLFYWFFSFAMSFLAYCMDIFSHSQGRSTTPPPREKPVFTPSASQQALFAAVEQKLSQPLFETNMRLLVVTNNIEETNARIRGFAAALASFDNTGYQSLVPKTQYFSFLPKINEHTIRYSFFQFTKRLYGLHENVILSVKELASIYHLPYTTTTKTEDIVKVFSRELPAPLSLKQSGILDTIFAVNTYGEQETAIGLTREERGRHMALFGTTGAGKSTMLLTMIKEDILHGEGILLIDPHGDLALKALSCVPENRADDLVWIDPDDLAHPVGLNLMELTPNLSEYDALREKEFIAESIISLFRKVFSDSLSGNPYRIEYILRNTIHTAFTVENATIFTIYDLLTDVAFRMQVTKKLTDKRLQMFWKTEFGKASGWQQVKMIAPVTARIGRFLFSPSARRILEQPKSTINFDTLLDQKKIVLCRFALGELGEDTAQVLGIMMLNKIQLAALKRARRPERERTDFFVYVDEFQNFANDSFMQMLSQTRKYKVNFIVAEQTTAQQRDKTLTNILLANTGTVVAFKLASPHDEQFLYPQFAPTVERGALSNLQAFHFYMKKGALNPEDPFSGITIPVEIEVDLERNVQLITRSNNKYTYVDETQWEHSPVKTTAKKQPRKQSNMQQENKQESYFPEENAA
jgi:hypothetical protein